ncbi:tetratricopeptide repeat-containing sulfotransferase family protein [Pseudoxanthomonas indica]|uniref:Sulfotransferase family protein n=1 Tax=Pseudoxanthomonas indica TaxID=428993 RepID=A0A1T5JPC7_9GAMM|nr:sulfotransferase [Pseudoxanthomonas indica]GGD43458.1 sulfotransferase [Pseudoxanthomonas indica]SKC53192.1 Sulfotransferase family protein [Pseudoxanthomonas indica]
MQNDEISALVAQGRQAIGERRFDEARQIYRDMLAKDPSQCRAWLALSAIAQQEGKLRETVETARSAAETWRNSDSNAFLAEVCMRLLMLGEYQTVRDLILGADWNDPVVLRASPGLVQYLGLVEAHDDALRLADHAIERSAGMAPALLYARATALRHLGRMDEAADAFEQVIAANPLHAEAHWALAHHARSEPAGARVPRLRKSAAHVSADHEDAIYFQYALFKELDDADRTEEAWAALERGAALKRKRLNYAASHDDESYQQLRTLCSREFVTAPGASQARAHHTPVFIVGLPRSGTTVIERMLGNHPQVQSAGELNDFLAQLSWEADRFMGEPLRQPGLEAVQGIDFEALGRGYLERTKWRAGDARLLVDKLPNNLLHAGFIHRALPDARIICVRRNPMDSCFSTFKHLFSAQAYPFSYDLSEMAAQYRRFETLVEHWSRVLPDRWLLADYEDVMREPEGWARHIAEFCGIEYDPAMIQIESNTAPAATASSSQVREGLHVRNIGSWQRYARWVASMGM